MTRRRIGVEERRARLAARHRLTTRTKAATPEAAVEGVVALHATDPASVYLAARARMRTPQVKALERALYDDRTLVRMLGMRRTMFVVPAGLAPVVQAACTRAVAVRQRRLLVELLEAAAITKDAGTWLTRVEEATVRALRARGQATAIELSQDEPRLRTQVTLAEGKAYGGPVNISTRVLTLLAADGRIIRGRPRGSWISGQYRWSTIESWLPDGTREWPTSEACVELVRSYIKAFGPATSADLRWWTGWTAAEVLRALGKVGAVEVDLDGASGFVLAGDVGPVRGGAPWVAMLPALDPTVMGWSGRDWYLGGHAKALFDRSGNAGPTVWWDGRVVGGWAQRKDGEIAVRLLEDIGLTARAAVDAEAHRLWTWIGSVRVTPRFRTPLERELSG